MLEKKLIEYASSNAYPFHMPGHKRNMKMDYNPYSIDITEITDFDDLHHAQGILQEAQQRAASLYGSEKCYYLVNGSTCGILAAISAAAQKGDKVIVARNCHKAVYHAIYLRELVPIYVYPEITSHNIQGQISVQAIKEAIKKNPDAKSIIITSPTYDGLLSDISSISRIAHDSNMSLIVDQAHGAHFGLDKSMPESAIKLGADCVIVSLHKTLPAFTQTALLHLCSDRIEQRTVGKYLDIYETSSPSYILMAGIDKCIEVISKEKEELFSALEANLNTFYNKVRNLKHLHVLTKKDFSTNDTFFFDKTKIIVSTSECDINGHELKSILTKKYNIELEMSSENYGLALASVMDTGDGFDRLANALIEIDSTCKDRDINKDIADNVYVNQNRKMEIHETDQYQQQECSLDKAAGKVCGEYIYFYPPGIPILVPGEIISEKNISDIKRALALGTEAYGLTENQMIFILKG